MNATSAAAGVAAGATAGGGGAGGAVSTRRISSSTQPFHNTATNSLHDLSATVRIVPESKDAEDPHYSAKHSIKARFAPLAERFQGFEDELLLHKQQRKQEAEQRILGLEKQIASLQTSIQLESKNRAQSMSAINAYMSSSLQQLSHDITTPINASLSQLNARLDALTTRLAHLERREEEKEQRVMSTIDEKVGAVRTALDREHEERVRGEERCEEKEKLIMNRIKADQQQRDEERRTDSTLVLDRITQMRNEFAQEQARRTHEFESLLDRLLAEEQARQRAVALEQQRRERNEHELVHAVQHYTATLQDGVRIVSSVP